LNEQLTPRSVSHAFLFICAMHWHTYLKTLRSLIHERSMRAIVTKYIMSCSLIIMCVISVYWMGNYECTLLYSNLRFSQLNIQFSEGGRCEHENRLLTLLFNLFGSTFFIVVSPSRHLPIITWLGRYSLVPYMAHCYFMFNGLKDRVEVLFAGASYIFVIQMLVPAILAVTLATVFHATIILRRFCLARRVVGGFGREGLGSGGESRSRATCITIELPESVTGELLPSS